MSRIRRSLAASAAAVALLSTVISAPTASAEDPAIPPSEMTWLDSSLPTEQRVDELMAAMTQSEKIAMLHGSSTLIGTRTINPDNPKSIGYVAAIPRLRIPAFVMTDGPAGLRNGEKATVFPAPITQASSFDPQVAYNVGRGIGLDSADRGQDLLFGPGFNLARNPQAGRTFEYFGEDPLLAGVTAAANVNGLQDVGVMATLKHYVANNQETNRTLNSSNIDQRTLHEIYEKPFAIAVSDANPAAVMCAYNQVNNVPACGNSDTLERDLRGQMGFEGLVVTDYPAAWSPTDIANGLNIELPGKFWTTEPRIREAIADGEMTWDDVDARVSETLTQMFRFGLFDHEWDPAINDRVREMREVSLERGHQIALETAEAGAVLLKNDGALPLDTSATDGETFRLLVVGEAAKNTVGGGGSSAGTSANADSVLGELRQALPDVDITWKSAADPLGIHLDAQSADAVIVVANDSSTELLDRLSLDFLPHVNNAIDVATRWNDNVTVVVQAGGPVLMPWLDDVQAVLHTWYPGEAGGEATTNLLLGEVNPSGRLPQTFPASNSQFPASEPRQFPGAEGGMQAYYDEGVFMGYRWYTEQDEAPLFSFGYGLSYTTFEYSRPRFFGLGRADDEVKVRVRVTNTGDVAGATVPQLYISKPQVEGYPMPALELAAFEKVELAPGESRTITMVIEPRELSYYDVDLEEFVVADGKYTISIGDSVTDIQSSAQYRVW